MIRTVSDLSFLVWGTEGCRVLHGEVVREQQLVWAKHCPYRWWVVFGRLTCLQVAAPSVRLFRCVWSCATYINSLQHQTDATGVSLKHTPHHTCRTWGRKKKADVTEKSTKTANYPPARVKYMLQTFGTSLELAKIRYLGTVSFCAFVQLFLKWIANKAVKNSLLGTRTGLWTVGVMLDTWSLDSGWETAADFCLHCVCVNGISRNIPPHQGCMWEPHS